MTLFTTRMLDKGFLATSGFNPTWAHQKRHVDTYFEKADTVFKEISESTKNGDIDEKIKHKPKHTGFARLVN